ncbi:hypothetical protein [Sinomonas flava]|uniref:hypothetical protein n=1 Tax=Sinomonas flava TaxID=496857 RepID=UPI0039A51D88
MTLLDRRRKAPAPGRSRTGGAQPPETDGARAARLRRRARLLSWGFPFVLLALVVAAKLLTMSAAAQQAIWAYDAKDGSGVSGAADWMGTADVVETHKSHFARGDALVLAGDFAGARSAFEEALRRTGSDDECTIRVNLVLATEKLGDAARDGGDAASADRLYADAATVIKQAPEGCFEPDSPQNQQQQGDRLGEARDRLERKRAEEQASGNQSQQPGQGTPPQSQPSAAPPRTPEQQAQDGRVDALERSSEAGQQERSEGDQRRDYLQNPPAAPVDRPW